MFVARILPLFAAALLSACAANGTGSGMSLFESRAEKALSAGIAHYDEGQYPAAVQDLQEALALGLDKPDQVRARKYLAFTHCVNGREKPCREEFRKALEIDPAFDLAPSEAGHPLWGPVFKGVKAKKKAS